MSQDTPTIFVSYSHEDQKYLDELLAAVKPTLRDVSTVEAWSDRSIAPGDSWETKIQAALESARAAVLLVSNNFLNSEYIIKTELPVLLARKQSGSIYLLVVYVARVAKPALGDLSAIQALNSPDRPLQGQSPHSRNTLFVELAERLHAWAAALKPLPRPDRTTPPHRPQLKTRTSTRPECWIRLHLEGSGLGQALGRAFLLPGHQHWLSPSLSARDALDQLALWRPGADFEGDLLFELLFGKDADQARKLLTDPYGASPSPSEPPRYPWRIRLLIGDQGKDRSLQCLPWMRIAYQGLPLAESGWTVELAAPPPPGARPELPNHAFIMPGRTLLVFPEGDQDSLAAAHRRDVQGMLQRLWDRPAPVFVAQDVPRLAAYLRDYAPRLVYFYGRATRDGPGWQLHIRDGEGGDGLGFDRLRGMLSSVPPSAVFLNLLGEDAVEAVPDTAALSRGPACKFVAVQATPRSEAGRAQRSAMAWLEAVLGTDKRLDPVAALHGTGHAFAACRTAYQEWDPQLGGAPLDEDLAHLLLDRSKQRAQLLQARDDFFDLASRLRVRCLLAAGAGGNRLADFPQQAITHL